MAYNRGRKRLAHPEKTQSRYTTYSALGGAEANMKNGRQREEQHNSHAEESLA